MSLILAVAAGGALGAVGRYLLIARLGQWLGTEFPARVNAVGLSLCGFFSGLTLALPWQAVAWWALALADGQDDPELLTGMPN